MSRETHYRLARFVLLGSLTITVMAAVAFAAFVAWALTPLDGWGAFALWLTIVLYLLWVLDILPKGKRK